MPPYTTFDAGVTAQLTRGTLTLAASNITNTYAGVFASPANAVPFTTAGGIVIPNIARPLVPRTDLGHVLCEVRPGRVVADRYGVPRPRRWRRPGAAVRAAPGEQGPPGGPEAGADFSRSSRRCRRRRRPIRSPSSQTQRRAAPTTAAKARQLAAELKAFAARVEAARTAAGYPATMPAPVLTDATITYHGLGMTYALAITPKGSGMLRAVAGCLSLHVARADDVTQRKLFAPSSPLFFVPQLNFMPAVGLYVVARQPQSGQEMFRVYKLPTTPPKDPFQVRTSQSCTGNVKNLATQSLLELRNHFANGCATPSWTITAHAAKGGTWFELDPGDPTVVPALVICGTDRRDDDRRARAHGFDGKPVPELNYAPSLGLYLIRPNNRPVVPTAPPSPSP